MDFLLDKKVCDLKTWELYVGFVLLQLLIGIAIALIVGIFDLAGIRGALGQVVHQLAVVMHSVPPKDYLDPIVEEIKEGHYI